MLPDGKGINLNPAAEPSRPDSDLRLLRTGEATVAFRTGRGGDIVEMNGGPEFTGALEVGDIRAMLGRGPDHYAAAVASFVRAGRGDDEISTGPYTDLVFAGRGDDLVTTGPRRDLIDAGFGRDNVSSGSGKDIVVAQDGRRDRIDCGAGKDRAWVDRIDVTTSCERLRTLTPGGRSRDRVGAAAHEIVIDHAYLGGQ